MNPARTSGKPITVPIAGALSIGNGEDGAFVTVTAGTTTVSVSGTFREVRDELRRLWRDLPATTDDLKAIEESLWHSILAEIEQKLSPDILADYETTVAETLGEIHGLRVTCNEWDDGWFPAHKVTTLTADGKPTALSEVIEYIWIDGLDDGDHNEDLKELAGTGFDRTWSYVLRRPH